MPLASGTRLGPYEIVSPLGAGGMGEVYRARDTRLERTVAIKVLGQNVDSRPELFQRFEREARTISTLNHPNICTLHDVGTHEGAPYLVMEYIEGETLSDRLMRGPLSLKEIWPIAIQIGEALDQAHRRGIVHRDLKPGNVMLAGGKGTTTVKLLDFGLAKASAEAQGAAAPGSLTSLPTVAQGLTVEGTIVGTFQYMSPEQLEGEEADTRSDIFAFGCVLYEMITGRKAFQGKSQATLISAIMTSEPPPIRAVQPMTPPALDRVVRKCLAKNADDRWQTARDLVGDLRWISESSSQVAVAPAVAVRQRIRFQAGWIAAAVLAAALAALLAMYRREPHPVEHTMRFLIPLPEGAGFRGDYDTAVLSPDGTHVVFTAEDAKGNPTLYVRSLDSLEAKPIPGTSGWRYGYFPFWSPDGRSIGFGADFQVKKIDLLGGGPATLCPVYGFNGGTWNRDGIILFSSYTRAIQRVSAGGGKPTPVTDNTGNLGGQAWPSFLPDGRHFLFTATAASSATGIYVGSLDSTDTKQVSTEISNAQYSSAGFLVFGRGGGAVMAQPFDAARLRVTSEPTQIASGAGHVISLQGSATATAFSVAGDTIVYLSGAAGAGLTQLTWFDRKGERQSVTGEAADWSNPALSPDGRTLAVCKRDPVSKMRDIWTFDVARGTPTRLTFDPADDFNPLWSPDGRQIVFASNRKGHRDLYRKASSGAGGEELLLESDLQKSCEDWTRDGRFVIFSRQDIYQGDREIWALPLFGDRNPFRVISGPGNPNEGHVSPDGKWISYTSVESGTAEIYVQDFPPTGGKWQVSFGGGNESSWSPSGKELFYLQGDRLMAVDVNTDSGRFDRNAPRILFEAPFGNPLRNAYLVSPDGQKFLVNTRVETKTTLPMTLVLNWPATLKH